VFVKPKLTAISTVGLIAAVLFAVLPVFWMVSTSFKQPGEWVVAPPIWISENPTWDNYIAVLFPNAAGVDTGTGVGRVSESAWRAITGSVLVASVATILSISVGFLAAVSISRYRIGGNTTPMFILSGRMFPPVAIAIPFLVMFTAVGLSDTYVGLILSYVAFTVPFSTWMLKSFVDELPKEIEEAAMIDGLSRIRAHINVTIPLIKGGIVATGLFIFILNWSEFLFALVLTTKDVITIPVQLSKYFTASAGQLYGVQAALGTIAVIPLVIIGFFIQSHLVRGLTFGAIKR